MSFHFFCYLLTVPKPNVIQYFFRFKAWDGYIRNGKGEEQHQIYRRMINTTSKDINGTFTRPATSMEICRGPSSLATASTRPKTAQSTPSTFSSFFQVPEKKDPRKRVTIDIEPEDKTDWLSGTGARGLQKLGLSYHKECGVNLVKPSRKPRAQSARNTPKNTSKLYVLKNVPDARNPKVSIQKRYVRAGRSYRAMQDRPPIAAPRVQEVLDAKARQAAKLKQQNNADGDTQDGADVSHEEDKESMVAKLGTLETEYYKEAKSYKPIAYAPVLNELRACIPDDINA